MCILNREEGSYNRSHKQIILDSESIEQKQKRNTYRIASRSKDRVRYTLSLCQSKLDCEVCLCLRYSNKRERNSGDDERLWQLREVFFFSKWLHLIITHSDR